MSFLLRIWIPRHDGFTKASALRTHAFNRPRRPLGGQSALVGQQVPQSSCAQPFLVNNFRAARAGVNSAEEKSSPCVPPFCLEEVSRLQSHSVFFWSEKGNQKTPLRAPNLGRLVPSKPPYPTPNALCLRRSPGGGRMTKSPFEISQRQDLRGMANGPATTFNAGRAPSRRACRAPRRGRSSSLREAGAPYPAYGTSRPKARYQKYL